MQGGGSELSLCPIQALARMQLFTVLFTKEHYTSTAAPEFREIIFVLKLWKSKHRPILGIDITSSAVKILEISKNGDSYCVENYRSEVLPTTALEGTTIKDIGIVANCINKLCGGSHFHGKEVALAVPDSAVIFKTVAINDGLNEEDLEELVVLEADKFIPYPIDEINLDFEIHGPNAKNSAMMDILIVASKAENVSTRVEAVTQAGFEARVVDVESFAVERAIQHIAKELPDEGKDKVIAIIDIGVNYTHLFVLNGMSMVFAREEKFGCKELIHAISQQYDMTFEQAQTAREQNNLPEDYETKVLEPFKERLLLQIKRTLQFFYSSSNQGAVDHILLAGGFAKQSGLAKLIKEQLEVETSIANPFSNMTIGKMVNLDAINNDAPSLLVACGLALRQTR